MPNEILLVVMFGALKLIALGLGAMLLVPLLRDDRVDPGTAGGEDEGGGNDRVGPLAPSSPPGSGLPVPLPDAAPARVRLREDKRLADLLPGPQRRPQHAPAPAPGREPAHD